MFTTKTALANMSKSNEFGFENSLKTSTFRDFFFLKVGVKIILYVYMSVSSFAYSIEIYSDHDRNEKLCMNVLWDMFWECSLGFFGVLCAIHFFYVYLRVQLLIF